MLFKTPRYFLLCICGSYTLSKQRKPVSAVVKKAYCCIKVEDQDKQYPFHIACKTICVSGLMERDKVYSLVPQWFEET